MPWQPPPATHAPSMPFPHHVPPEYPEYVDGPLTYQWTDGTIGQTPQPPIIPGYERLVAAAVQRVQTASAPNREGPALATNPPPNPNQYDAYERTSPGYHPGYDLLPPGPPTYRHPHPHAHPPHLLHPHPADLGAAWHPPSPPFPSAATNGSLRPLPDVMSYPPPASHPPEEPRPLVTVDELGLPVISQDPRPFDLLTAPAQTAQTGQASEPAEPAPVVPVAAVAPVAIKVEKVSSQTDGPGPNMPPPDQSPKLSSDLMACLQEDPPPPDKSPT